MMATQSLCVQHCKTDSIMHLIGMHELHTTNWDAAWANASQLKSCNYFVGSCGPTHPSHPMISSTTSASRYGPLKFQLLSNFQQLHICNICGGKQSSTAHYMNGIQMAYRHIMKDIGHYDTITALEALICIAV